MIIYLYLPYNNRPIDSLLHNDAKKELFTASIQLHNKLRSLPTSVAEAKGYIKAACAWLIIRSGDIKPASAESYMKVFIRAGQELSVIENVEAKEVAVNCLDQALSSWHSITPAVFERSLNPIDYEQLKSSIIQSYITKLKTLHELHGVDLKSMNECVHYCREMIQSAQYSSKLNFTKILSSIAQHLAQLQPKEKYMDDAANYFSTALQNLDALSRADIDSISKTSGTPTLLWLKIRLNLSLSYVHCERDECEKAMECVNICESLSLEPMALENRPADSDPEKDKKEIINALHFAKFTINCKACDYDGAKTNLKSMIDAVSTPTSDSSSSSIDTIVYSIQALDQAMGHKNNQQVFPLYKTLLLKFKDDRDTFNTIRIAMFKFLLQAAELTASSGDDELDPNALCDAVVSDHVNNGSRLNEAQLASMRSLLRQRITWHHLNAQHHQVIQWCDHLIRITEYVTEADGEDAIKSHVAIGEGTYWGESTLNSWSQCIDGREFDPKECYTTSLLQKAESLLSLHEYDRAFSAAASAVHVVMNTRAVCIIFLCSVYVNDDVDKSIDLLLSYLWPYSLNDQGKVVKLYPKCNKGLVNGLTPSFKIMTLERIMVCVQLVDDKLAAESSEKVCNKLRHYRERLFQDWLHVFEEWEVFNCYREIKANNQNDRSLDEEFDARFRDDVSYLSVLGTIFYEFTVDKFTEIHGDVRDDDESIIGAKRPIDFDPASTTGNGPFLASSTTTTATTIVETVEMEIDEGEERFVTEVASENIKIIDVEPGVEVEAAAVGVETEGKEGCTQGTEVEVEEKIDLKEDTVEVKEAETLTKKVDGDEGVVVIKCSIEEISSQLKRFEGFVKMQRSGNVEVESLGKGDDYHWLGDYCWNIGVSLLNPSTSIGTSDNDKDYSFDVSKERMTSAADFLEFSDCFYSFVELDEVSKSQTYQSIRTNQAVALLISSAARLDLHKDKLTDATTDALQSSEALNKALYNTRRARCLLQLNGGFKDHRIQKHMTKSLILEFRNLCYRDHDQLQSSSSFAHDNNEPLQPSSILSTVDLVPKLTQLSEFYENNKDLFNCYMQPIDLQHCANIARKTYGGNLEVSRCLLDMAIQISLRDPFPAYHRIGNMYYELISTAGTRQKAFEKIEDFLQLITTLGNQGDENIQLFSADDIDAICSVSYNYGVSLMELSNFDFAEKFISKSLALLAFTSQALSGWKSNMQDAYSQVLRAKVDARSLTSKRESSTIFELDKSLADEETSRINAHVTVSAQILNASMFE